MMSLLRLLHKVKPTKLIVDTEFEYDSDIDDHPHAPTTTRPPMVFPPSPTHEVGTQTVGAGTHWKVEGTMEQPTEVMVMGTVLVLIATLVGYCIGRYRK